MQADVNIHQIEIRQSKDIIFDPKTETQSTNGRGRAL